MTDEQKQRAEIRANEAWLKSVLPPDGTPDIAIIKQRVRIAIDEAWLGDHLDDSAQPSMADSIKQRLRANETAAQKAPFEAQSARRLWRPAGWLAGLSAAAMVAFAFIPVNRELDEMASADAFEQYQVDEFDSALHALDSDLQDLELVIDDWGQLSNSTWLEDDFS